MSVEQDETSGFETSVNDYPVEAETEAQEIDQGETQIDDSRGAEEEAENEGKKADNSGENATAEDDKAEQEEAEEPKPKKQNRVQKRIDDVVREREEAKRRAEAAEKRLAELEDKKTDGKSDQASEPVESDYETYDDYLNAVDEFDQQQESKAKEEPEKSDKPNSDELTDAQRTAMALIKEKVDQDAEKYSDFADVALNPEVPITGEMLEALAECDDPTKVMYHLGQNKDLAAQIAEKSPAQQMREIAKLDLTAVVKPPKPTKTTQASDPISPVGGSSTQEKAMEDMSFSEYEAAMNAKEKNSGAGW
jgi:hypothetical protein